MADKILHAIMIGFSLVPKHVQNNALFNTMLFPKLYRMCHQWLFGLQSKL